jgi:hypothetical protein
VVLQKAGTLVCALEIKKILGRYGSRYSEFQMTIAGQSIGELQLEIFFLLVVCN